MNDASSPISREKLLDAIRASECRYCDTFAAWMRWEAPVVRALNERLHLGLRDRRIADDLPLDDDPWGVSTKRFAA